MVTLRQIHDLVDDRPQDGIFRVHTDVFGRQDIFDLEMEHIFEAGWNYVGLECQVPAPHDFFVTHIGRQSVIVSRDQDGKLHGLLNSCRHRGAMICQVPSGNRRVHVCPYHAWGYDSAGRNIAVPGRDRAAYTQAFDNQDQDLKQVARIESYRGFIFASLSADVLPLRDYLGSICTFIDLAVDQSKDGLELIPGTVRYIARANWKFLIENSADSYHFLQTHQSYLAILRSRDPTPHAVGTSDSGCWTFSNGHSVYWSSQREMLDHPLEFDKAACRERVGDVRAKWMKYIRNALVFPNMLLLEAPVLQVRVIRPLSPEETEITTYCIAPRGESREARRKRLRLYEEFFNPGGLATPDDMAVLQACQAGRPQADGEWLQGYMRGIGHSAAEGEAARELGVVPLRAVSASAVSGDETIFHGPLREWRRMLVTGMSGASDSTAPSGGAR